MLATGWSPIYPCHVSPRDMRTRPILFYLQNANCWRPRLHGLTTMANSIYNSWRFEDVWLDN